MTPPQRFVSVAIVLLGGGVLPAIAQRDGTVVSFVTASTIYVEAGRTAGFAAGDTLHITRHDTTVALAVIFSASEHYSAATIVARYQAVSPGDIAINAVAQTRGSPATETRARIDTTRTLPAYFASQVLSEQSHTTVKGLVSVEYMGIFAESSRLNLQQPAARVQLTVRNLLGTGMSLQIYDRSTYDHANVYGMYNHTSGFEHRLTLLSLQHDAPADILGFGLGRQASSYVPALGLFDGVAARITVGELTAGFAGGADPQGLALGSSPHGSRGAVFLNYHHGDDLLHSYNGTLAYARQLHGGDLDREFLSLENRAFLGREWSIVQSAEIDLKQSSFGGVASAFSLSNMLVMANYTPTGRFSAYVGYDATRPLYLLESTRTLADSLLDRSVLQGFRATLSERFDDNVTGTATVAVDGKQGDARAGHQIGGSLRVTDLFRARVNSDIRFTNTSGPLSRTDNFMVDVDRTFGSSLSAALRFVYNRANISTVQQSYATYIGTVDLYYVFSRSHFASLMVDYVNDSTMNSVNVMFEIGVRF